MCHGGERDPVRHAQLGEHVPQAGCWRVRRAVQPPGHATVGQSPATSSDTARSIAVRPGGPPALRVYTSSKLASRGLARLLARCRIAHTATPFAEAHCVQKRCSARPGWPHAYLSVDIPIRRSGTRRASVPITLSDCGRSAASAQVSAFWRRVDPSLRWATTSHGTAGSGGSGAVTVLAVGGSFCGGA